jgi:hypothetical protein
MAAKYCPARLVGYFTGYEEHMAMREEAMERRGEVPVR